MTTLFEPLQAGRMHLANRVVMAPLTRNRAPGAMPNDLMVTYYTQRADPKNGAGLIITEATATRLARCMRPAGRGSKRVVMFQSSSC